MLACRTCRRPLNAAEGCAICFSVKANLVSTDENTEDNPALSDVGAEVVSALRAILRAHKATIKESDELDSVVMAREGIIKVANTLAKVLEAARKLQADGANAVRNMSFTERATLFAEWYQTLPPGFRQKVMSGMQQFEHNTNKALAEGTPDE